MRAERCRDSDREPGSRALRLLGILGPKGLVTRDTGQKPTTGTDPVGKDSLDAKVILKHAILIL